MVSVILPVRNAERFLWAAVSSILGQTLADFELIAIDDGSTDSSGAILEDLASRDMRIRVLREQSVGLTAALNRGLRAALGQFVARMDADDSAHSNRLAVQTAYLVQSPNVVAVGSAYKLMDERDRVFNIIRPPASHDEIVLELLRGRCPMNHPSVVMRRSALEDVGGYDERFRCGQDYDLWLRLSEVGRLANLAEPLMRYRHHGNSITEERNEEQCAVYRQAWQAAVARRQLPGIDEPDFRTWRASRRLNEYEIARYRAYSAWQIGEYHTATAYGLKCARQLSTRPAQLADEITRVARRMTRGRRSTAHGKRAAP